MFRFFAIFLKDDQENLIVENESYNRNWNPPAQFHWSLRLDGMDYMQRYIQVMNAAGNISRS